MSPAAYTKTGSKSDAAVKLDKAIFAQLPESHELLKRAYTAYLANGRENLAVTKTRGLVSGGGKKPWRQKGTGRARVGSTRSPIWRSGGITFGPTGNENYSVSLNVQAKRKALRQALSLKAADGSLKIIETFDCKDGKVKTTLKLLDKVEAKGATLIAISKKDDLAERATRNIPRVKLVQANYLNVYDILNADTILLSKKGLEMVNQWLAPKKATPAKATTKESAE